MKACAYIILVIFSFASSSGFSQNDNSIQNRNSVHLELGGTGGYYSLNYERNIINHNSFKTSVQFGIRYFPGVWSDIWLPIGINELFSFNAHHIEIGIGVVTLREMARDQLNNYAIIDRFWSYALTGRLGYRYQKPDGRFIWRIGFTPFLQRERGGLIYDPTAKLNIFNPWGGLSIGYSF